MLPLMIPALVIGGYAAGRAIEAGGKRAKSAYDRRKAEKGETPKKKEPKVAKKGGFLSRVTIPDTAKKVVEAEVVETADIVTPLTASAAALSGELAEITKELSAAKAEKDAEIAAAKAVADKQALELRKAAKRADMVDTFHRNARSLRACITTARANVTNEDLERTLRDLRDHVIIFDGLFLADPATSCMFDEVRDITALLQARTVTEPVAETVTEPVAELPPAKPLTKAQRKAQQKAALAAAKNKAA